MTIDKLPPFYCFNIIKSAYLFWFVHLSLLINPNLPSIESIWGFGESLFALILSEWKKERVWGKWGEEKGRISYLIDRVLGFWLKQKGDEERKGKESREKKKEGEEIEKVRDFYILCTG